MLHGLGLVRGLGYLALQRVDAVATPEIWQVAWQSGNLAFPLRQHGQENQHANVLVYQVNACALLITFVI